MRNLVTILASALLLAFIVALPLPAHATTSSVYSPLDCPGISKTGWYINTHSDGTLHFKTSQVKLTGYTFYPADYNPAGAAAWQSSGTGFDTYIDKTLANEAYLGANIIRPTDQFDDNTAGQTWDNANVWEHMDHLVCQAALKGTFVDLDLSFMKHVLTSQGLNVLDPANWYAMIDAVSAHYYEWQSIGMVSFNGEPQINGLPYPQTQADTTTLVNFYTALLARYYQHDTHTNMTVGGLTHTMYGYPNWWQQVAGVPHDKIFAYKVYSSDDESYLPNINTWATSHGTMAVINEEFGMPQGQGDGTWSGQVFNGLSQDRADFYTWNYQQYQAGKFQAAIFWNDSCLANGTSNYDVNPAYGPAVISVIRQYAAVTPTASAWSGWSC